MIHPPPTIPQARHVILAENRPARSERVHSCRRQSRTVRCVLTVTWTGALHGPGGYSAQVVAVANYTKVVGWHGDRLVAWEAKARR